MPSDMSSWCAASAPLIALPTSSSSVQLRHADGGTCHAAAFEVLYRPEGADDWISHEQLGWSLPFELGSLDCGGGCRFKLRALNATSYAHRARLFNLSAEHHHMLLPQRADGEPIESAQSEAASTPHPPVEAPHPPAVRLELFLQPALARPIQLSLSSYVSGLVSQLTSPHFLVTPHRILPVEASSTGSFLILDVHPENIFTATSGPDVPRLIQRIAVRADDLYINVPPQEDPGDAVAGLPEQVVSAVYGRFHHMDPRFGLWQQAVHGTFTRQAARASRLWPRLHLWAEAPAGPAPVAGEASSRGGTGGAGGTGGGAREGWWSNPFDDDDDDAGDTVEMQQAIDRQVVLDPQELEQLLSEELRTEAGRHEPVLKSTVLLLSLLMLCAVLRSAAGPRLASLCAARRPAPATPTGAWAGHLPLLCATAVEATARFGAQVWTWLYSLRPCGSACEGAVGGRMGWLGKCCLGRGSHAPLPTSEEDPLAWDRASRSQDGGAQGSGGVSSEAQLQAWLALRKGKRAFSQHA